MFRSLLVIVMSISGLAAQDMRISKDSLWLYSDDVRTPAKTSLHRGSIETCLFGDSLDFSSIDDTCQIKKNTSGGACIYNTCAVLTPDVRIKTTKIYAPKGILNLGNCADTNCLDTLKRVPKSGYLDSANVDYMSGGNVFAVRTSEMNYAALYTIRSISEIPFRPLKWLYQPDGTADFIKGSSVQTKRRETNTTLRNLKANSNRGNMRISWTPVAGTLQFQLFDLRGRQLRRWECDGRQGAADAAVEDLNIARCTHVLNILLRNETDLIKESRILSPR